MKKTFFITLSISLLFYSCKENIEKKTIPKEPQRKEEFVLKKDTIISTKLEYSLLDNDVDVKNIQFQLDDVTSGFMPKVETQIYPRNKKNKNFVHYTLIKYPKEQERLKQSELQGMLIVYDSVDPYHYGTDTEEFMDIYLSGEEIYIYDNQVKVGMHYKDVIKNFGNNFTKVDSTIIYKKDNRTALFKIKDSIVTRIRIGKFRNDLNTEEILNNNLW
ncbi:hypothetical protein DVK85_02030 [Flavobacterium arcticum]|uniref:Lipoprotein n=1 Tax=Flavobacterium arcticum TaxID=1784713 RepID=A0A345H914_9FLAO|nr:hypothetical protein [Flavobacterium arcticum]AXG73074.1 hypothetical protein DVK85_02030 [Flavobacterium arcticum]KAF2512866.1 hypothetical protein E0W72_00100 [Flavobacterium arcticum]